MKHAMLGTDGARGETHGRSTLSTNTPTAHPINTSEEERPLAVAARLLQTNQPPELRHGLNLSFNNSERTERSREGGGVVLTFLCNGAVFKVDALPQ